MGYHFRSLTFLFIFIVNLSLLPEAMNPDPPIKALAPASTKAIEKAKIRKSQMELNSFLGNGRKLANSSTAFPSLTELFELFGIKAVVVLKFEDVPTKLFKEKLKPLKGFLKKERFGFHILAIETKENEKTKEKILVAKGTPPDGAFVVGTSGGEGGGRAVEVLRKKFSLKVLVGLLWHDKMELRLRKSKRRSAEGDFSFSVLPLVGSFPILTQEALSHFLVELMRKRAIDRAFEFVHFLASNGIKAIAFAFDRTITAGASLGAMPPENVEGSEASWKKIKKLSEDFEDVVAVLEFRHMPLYIVTFSDEKIKNQIMDSHEREEWLQHHYGESPPDMDFNELMKRTVAGETLVRRVLKPRFIKPALIVAGNPRYRPELPKHKSSHLQEVRKPLGLHPSEVLLIDYERASVLDARREGYPVLQVMGTKGFDLANLVAPL